eukprot:1858035-Heterocapsa_arctica.AAC.1
MYRFFFGARCMVPSSVRTSSTSASPPGLSPEPAQATCAARWHASSAGNKPCRACMACMSVPSQSGRDSCRG